MTKVLTLILHKNGNSETFKIKKLKTEGNHR